MVKSDPTPVVLAVGSTLLTEAVRAALAPVSSLQLAGEADNVNDLSALSPPGKRAILLLSTSLPGMDSFGPLIPIRGDGETNSLPLLVLLLTQTDLDPQRLSQILAAKPRAIIQPEVTMSELICVLQLVAGNMVVYPALQSGDKPFVRPNIGAIGSTVRLSQRERQILELLARGFSEKEVAARLTIGTRTIHTYLERTRTKLGATNRVHAVAKAIMTRQFDP